jgi:hypothetical protein
MRFHFILEIDVASYDELLSDSFYQSLESSYMNADKRVIVKLPYDERAPEKEQEIIDTVQEHFKQEYDELSTFLDQETKWEATKRYLSPVVKSRYHQSLGAVSLLSALALPFTTALAPITLLAGGAYALSYLDTYANCQIEDRKRVNARNDLSDLEIEFFYS